MSNFSATDLAEAMFHASKVGTTLRRFFAAWVTLGFNNSAEKHLEAAKNMDVFLAGEPVDQAAD